MKRKSVCDFDSEEMINRLKTMLMKMMPYFTWKKAALASRLAIKVLSAGMLVAVSSFIIE